MFFYAEHKSSKVVLVAHLHSPNRGGSGCFFTPSTMRGCFGCPFTQSCTVLEVILSACSHKVEVVPVVSLHMTLLELALSAPLDIWIWIWIDHVVSIISGSRHDRG